ncbi:MAG TPA: ABC transporter substrate-binding protein [Opitutaceae bacterium]|nr:ABC transporter substrate-binding protein [Opitutaceae bacterium]
MLKRGIIILALVATVVAPFMLRPRQPSPEQADDTLIIITPHNAAIRDEFTLGFQDWYKARTGRTVFVDWRVVGGTSEIARYLEGEYVASFRNLWTGKAGRTWSAEIQSGFQNARLKADAAAVVRSAREAFLASEAGCGIDLFFGGGAFDFDKQARAGRLVDSGLRERHADWFTDDALPLDFGGEEIRDAGNLWFGTVLSSYGILFNRDSLKRLGFDREPEQWADLADPRLLGEIGLCDPTKSGSIAVAFENVIQQQVRRRLDALRAADPAGDPKAAEEKAVRQGWSAGMRLLQLVGANARYFTDTSQKPPIDVAAGDCAAGMCIDFYGREQQEAVRRRNGSDRLGYVSPEGGSAFSVDPIALLRGAPHRPVAVAFIEFVLSLDGQKLWNFRTGTPGGPRHFALRRLPVRRDFYARGEWARYRSDPEVDPYSQREVLVHHSEWASPLYTEAFVIRLMTEDTHQELAQAWRAIIAAPEPSRARALAVLQDVSPVDFDQACGPITRALASENQVDEVRFARDLGDTFRRHYARAERIARGGE